VRVTTRGGGIWLEERDGGRRRWRRTPSEQTAALTEKFSGLVEPVLGAGATTRLRDMVLGLEEVADVQALLSGSRS
jgi:hypothetical protein